MKRRPRQEHALDVLEPDLLEKPLRRRCRVHAAEAIVGESDDERGERRSVPPGPVRRVDAQRAEDPDEDREAVRAARHGQRGSSMKARASAIWSASPARRIGLVVLMNKKFMTMHMKE